MAPEPFDCIRIITSNSWGDPLPGADPRYHGHAVRQSSSSAMTRVNQLSDGGRFVHNDCAVASAISACADRHVAASAPDVEAMFATSTTGTWLPNLVAGMAALGLQPRLLHENPPPGWVMNPLGGRLLAPEVAPEYDAASELLTVYIDAPLPAAPPPAAQEADDVKQWTQFYGPNAATFLSDGTFFEWQENGQALSNRLYVLSKTNPLPVNRWNGPDTPVTDPRAFGRPVPGDDHTLAMARQCWPAAGF